MFLGFNESNWSSGLPCIQFLGSWPHTCLQTPQHTSSLGGCSSCSPLPPVTPHLPYPLLSSRFWRGRGEEGRSHCPLCLLPLLRLLLSCLCFSSWHSCLSEEAFNLHSLLPPTTHTHTNTHLKLISSVQSLSHVQLFVTPWTPAHQASLSITNSWSLLKLMSIALVMPSNHLILCHLLLLLPSIFPWHSLLSASSREVGIISSM